jgi:hypothetical protein
LGNMNGYTVAIPKGAQLLKGFSLFWWRWF